MRRPSGRLFLRQDAAPAATGHPWPIAALPASMPGGPLRRTSSRPPDGAGRSNASEAADRPACLNAGFSTDISPCGSRACPRCRHLVLSGGTKCCHRGQARSHNGLVLFKSFAFAAATRLIKRRECWICTLWVSCFATFTYRNTVSPASRASPLPQV